MVARLRKFLSGDVVGVPRGLDSPTVREAVSSALERELSEPPRIAVIGETGVGKSSTINALFAAGLDISHTSACTQRDTEIEYEVAPGEKLRIVDLPGLGEDLDADKRHLETYARVLPTCDVVLWVLKADNRAIAHVQTSLRSLVRKKVVDPKKLVVALNQVDLLQPGSWDLEINQPSPEQEETIVRRRDDVVQKLRAAGRRLPELHVVGYSATRRYHLELLLEALLHATDDSRRWLLHDRAHCADFNELVHLAPLDQHQEETK